MTRTEAFTSRAAHRVAHAAAWLVSLVRPLVLHTIPDAECEARGLPLDSTEPVVYLQRPSGMPWWRLAVWLDGPDGSTEGCLHVDLLGWAAEVYYRRQEVTARA